MQRWFVSLAFAGVLSVVLAGAVSAQVQIQIQVQAAQVQPANQVQALRVAVMPGVMYNQTRMMQADAIFTGRVVALEPMDVEAPSAPGQAKVSYRVAVVQVADAIHGLAKGVKVVRVGFVTQANNVPVPPGGIQILPAIQPGQAVPPGFGRRPFPGNIQINLQVGQDGLFALNKHHKENFYLAPSQPNFIQRENNPNFDNEVKTAKQLSKAMANPIAALKAEDKQDRYLAAAILITKYRTNPTGAPMKTAPIDAAESKLILKALAEGDWTPGRFNASIPNPFELFNQLGINQKDGYNPVNGNQQNISTAMQKWLDENNGKYRIQKLIADPNAKAAPPGVQPGVIRPLPPVQIQPLPAPAPKQD